MAIIYDNELRGVAGGGRRQKKTKKDCCADCAGGATVAGLLEGIGLGALPGRRGGALRKLARAHRSGELAGLGGLGDLDTSALVVDRTQIDAEDNAFDGRLNAWMLDYAAAAAALPPAYVQQVDDFVSRWRAFHADWYFVGANRVSGIVAYEAEFNRLRDQFESYGHSTSITAATVTAGGKTVRADEIPAGSTWFDQVKTVAIWGGVIVGGVALMKISSDLGVFRGLGHVIRGKEPAT